VNGASDRLLIPATPTTYTLELTSHCNSQCIGCGNVFDRALGCMRFDHWQTILLALQPHIISLRVTGGEPTLHPDFHQIIRLIDQLAVPFVIFSNGLWPNRDRILRLLLDCRHLDGLLISLHGHDAATHRAFAGVDSFDQVVTTIRQATAAGVNINTNSVLTRANCQHIAAIARLSQELGARYAAFSRYYGPPQPITDLTADEFRQAAAAVHDLRQRNAHVQFNNCVPVCFDRQPTKSCPAGITHCTIDPLGQVRPCTHAPQVLGDLFSQPIEAIWQSEAASCWRDRIPAACATCAEFTRCRGACKAMAYHQHCERDPLMCEPLATAVTATQSKQINLYSLSRPKSNYVRRNEAFGYLLVNRNQIIPVQKEAGPLLDRLESKVTLQDIEHEFGQRGLAFVALLFNKGLLCLDQGSINDATIVNSETP
jgi:radical SAM protein with 4Fe4S-binding SPASM domain